MKGGRVTVRRIGRRAIAERGRSIEDEEIRERECEMMNMRYHVLVKSSSSSSSSRRRRIWARAGNSKKANKGRDKRKGVR